MKGNRKYLIAVALLTVLAVVFGLAGTVAPPLAEEAKPSESSSSSSSSSVAHFANPPTYDSGWVEIRSNTGQYVSLKHNLNTTDVVVYITGKQSLDPVGGALAWSRNYGVADGRLQEASSVVQTSDDGYALAGYNCTVGSVVGDFCLVKVDSAGNLQWSKNYGRFGTSELAWSLVLDTFDDGYALAGHNGTAAYYDFCLVKVDSAGNLQWSKNYGGADDERAYSLVQTFDGGYALAGYNTSGGFTDFCLVKVDSAGNLQWSKNYGGADDELAYSLVLDTFDDGYALAGYNSSAGNDDFCLVKVDSAGNLQWSKNYGGADDELAYSLVQTSDDGYALAGLGFNTSASYTYFCLVKVMPEDFEHQRNLGTETGLTCAAITNTTIILYRGTTDAYWNYVHVRIWLIKEPTWIYGDINMDGVVDAQDLYILGQNYGKTFSVLSLGGIAAIAGVHTYKKRKRNI